MKISNISAIALTVTLLSATSLLAQKATTNVTDNQQAAASQTAYYIEQTRPDISYLASTNSLKGKTFATSLYRVRDSMKMRLSLQKKYGDVVSICLLNQNEKEMYWGTVGRRVSKYACIFDFAAVKDGDYTIVIGSGKEVERKVVRLSSAEVVLSPARDLIVVK